MMMEMQSNVSFLQWSHFWKGTSLFILYVCLCQLIISNCSSVLYSSSIGYEDSSIFPLLGTLLGNDYADARLFENVFAQIHLPKSKTMTDQHCKLQGLLDWLRGQSVEDAIDQVLLV